MGRNTLDITTRRLEMPRLGASRNSTPAIAASVVRGEAKVCFATISDVVAFEALRTEWSALFDASGRPHQVFQTFEWLSIWASLYVGAGTRLAVVTGRIDGRLVMAWPLVVRHVAGLDVLSFMGEPLSQYGDALIADDFDASSEDAAFDYVMSLAVDVVSLRRVRDDAALAPLLIRRLGASTNRQTSPFVDFADAPTAEAFEKRFPGKLRGSRRRRRRRLEERGPVTFAHHAPSPEAAALVVDALRFKREWASQTGVVAPALRDPRFEKFFVAAALAGARAPDLRVSALRGGDDIFGIEISVVCKGHLFGHVLAPRPGFGSLGLGGLLAEATILNALERGHAVVDLLAPADSYKVEWTTTSVGVGDYSVSKTVLGLLYTKLWLTFGRDAVKAIVHRFVPGLVALGRRAKSRGCATVGTI